jgi:2,3-diketo-5-methylthio-1-phosphopentane phosphatase
MPFAYLCDFDGTISPTDIGAEFVRRFTTRTPAESEALIERWRAGLLGNREVASAECAGLSVTPEEALAFVRGFALDPHFAPFTAAAAERGDHVVVVSEGFDFYVRDRLEHHGLADLPWSANRVRFDRGRVRLEFPHVAPDGCPGCGNCKGARVRASRRLGREVVLVGDGLSDRCGARLADHVVARGELLAWCRAEGIAAVEFESFADVERFALRMAHGPARHN